MLFPYFVYIAHFTKFTRGSSLLTESLLMEKSKAEESPWWKEKNTGPKKRKRVPFWQEKKKILRESDWQWRSSTLASKFRTKKSPSKTKFAMHNVKNEVSFSFCMPCYKNMNNRLECNFESCRSICCLAPQHIFRFFHFCCGFFLCLWQLCSLLYCPSQRSNERSR